MKIFDEELFKKLHINSEVSGKFIYSKYFFLWLCLVKVVSCRKECLKVVCLAKLNAPYLFALEWVVFKRFYGNRFWARLLLWDYHAFCETFSPELGLAPRIIKFYGYFGWYYGSWIHIGYLNLCRLFILTAVVTYFSCNPT